MSDDQHEAYRPLIEDGRGIFCEDFRMKAPRGFSDAVRAAAQRQHMTRAEYARRALLRSTEADGVTLRRGLVELTKPSVEEWLSIRKKEGLKIDPEAAEVDWACRQILDPYGMDPNLPEECDCVGRVYFARRPGSEIWVAFYDLPDEARAVLWDRLKSGLTKLDDEVPWA